MTYMTSWLREVTMMRGAQSGGVVTFTGSGDLMGARARVVNQQPGSNVIAWT